MPKKLCPKKVYIRTCVSVFHSEIYASKCTNVIVSEMQDFSLLSSKTVVEVLMLEIKMAPSAKTYIVSGFPRNMRDVVEYSEKVSIYIYVPIKYIT